MLESQVRKTARRIETGTVPGGIDSLDKLLLTEVEQDIYSLGLDLLGPFRTAVGSRPHGLHAERMLHDYFASRAFSISGGTSQIQMNIVAERMLGLPRT